MNYEPQIFELEKSSVWSFKERGDWATHDSKYRGNCSPYVFRNLIIRYSSPGDKILDQFVGGGTSVIEAKLLNRDIIGVDINPKSVELSINKLNFAYGSSDVEIRIGDAQKLDFINDHSIDFICTHPPYSDIIKYSNNIDGDLSRLEYSDFLKSMESVAKESYRVLKTNKFCAFVIGDIRKKGFVKPLGFETLQLFQNEGFSLKEIIIKQQYNCKGTSKWAKISNQNKFILLAHEYIFVLKKCN